MSNPNDQSKQKRGMEYTDNPMEDFGAARRPSVPVPAPKKPSQTPPPTVEEAREALRTAEEEPTAQMGEKTEQTAKKSTSSGAKKSPRASASTASGKAKSTPQGQKSGKDKKTPKKEKVNTDLPTSAKPIHKILPWVFGLLVVFVGLSLIFNLFCNRGNKLASDPGAHWMGYVGYYICYALFGLFGPAAFAIPFILLNLAVYWRTYIDHRLAISKIAASVLGLTMISTLIHVFNLQAGHPDYPVGELMEYGARMTGGGVLGGKLGWFLFTYLNLAGSLILSFFLLFACVFYFIGMTPQHLWERIRNRRQLTSARTPSASEHDAEEAAIRAEMDERIRKTVARKPVVMAEGVPEGAVTPLEGNGKKAKRATASEDKLAPMPLPVLDPGDGLTPFIPRNLDQKNGAEAPAKAPEKPVSVPAKAPGTKATAPVRLRIGDQEIGTAEKPTQPTGTATAPAPAKPQTPVARTNRDAGVEPIFPQNAELRAARRVPKEDRGFDIGNVFMDLDDKDERAEAKPRHAPLPPEVPMGASTTAPASPQKPTGTPATAAGRPVTRPAAPKAAAGQPLFRKADEENAEFGLSNDEFEKLEAGQGKLPASGQPGAVKAPTAKPGVASAATPSATSAATPVAKPAAPVQPKPKKYVFPPLDLLHPAVKMTAENQAEIRENMTRLAETLQSFRVSVQEINYSSGPTVTRYEVTPAVGVRVRSIVNLSDDIALAFAAQGIRIEAPIPGKSAIGIEVPNKTRCTVYLRELLESEAFTKAKGVLTSGLGSSVNGSPLYMDVAKMPHMLIAGTTGSGKSVCINSVLISVLYRCKPEDVKILLIDPKKVEFKPYKSIPHLLAPIITTPKDATGALQAAVDEMERRYELMEQVGAKSIKTYNEVTENDPDMPYMPHILIVIDELADLMMTAKEEVETAICRIAQKARAAGMHLIVGTQRPSVDVVTGLIKSNIPSRIAFTVASQVDSKTILDYAGAEKLLGMGDMLFAPIGSLKPSRVQGAFVDEKEVEAICNYVSTKNAPVVYDEHFVARLKELAAQSAKANKNDNVDLSEDGDNKGVDPKYADAVKVAVEEKRVSTSLLQRKLEIGYGRAAKIIDRMQAEGLVSPPDGAKPRSILITPEQYIERFVMKNGEDGGEN